MKAKTLAAILNWGVRENRAFARCDIRTTNGRVGMDFVPWASLYDSSCCQKSDGMVVFAVGEDGDVVECESASEWHYGDNLAEQAHGHGPQGGQAVGDLLRAIGFSADGGDRLVMVKYVHDDAAEAEAWATIADVTHCVPAAVNA